MMQSSSYNNMVKMLFLSIKRIESILMSSEVTKVLSSNKDAN